MSYFDVLRYAIQQYITEKIPQGQNAKHTKRIHCPNSHLRLSNAMKRISGHQTYGSVGDGSKYKNRVSPDFVPRKTISIPFLRKTNKITECTSGADSSIQVFQDHSVTVSCTVNREGVQILASLVRDFSRHGAP